MDATRSRRRFCTRWRLIESMFSHSLPAGEPISGSRAAKGERGIRQRRYWEHTVRDESDFARHVDYIHINPVKHGLVARVRDWPFSSFHRMVKLGVYPEDWAGAVVSGDTVFGERDRVRRAQPILRSLWRYGAAAAAKQPDGQITRRDQNLSSPPAKNISLNLSGKSALPARPVLSRQEGRIAIVTNAGRMRWTRQRRRAGESQGGFIP